MSLLKVNNIESLTGPTGAINITGNLIVNGMPIAGASGAIGSPGPTGPEGAGGISGSTLVYVSADSDPATNGLGLQAAYNTAKALATSTLNTSTNSLDFYGMGVYMNIGYSTFLQAALIQTFYYGGNSSPIAILVNGTTAYYSWDGMSIKMSRTYDMMTPVEIGTWDVVIDIRVYTESTLIIAPGYYEMDSTFNIDSDNVNITSLSGNPDVFIYNLLPAVNNYSVPTVYVTSNFITITGLSTDLSHLADSPSMPGMYTTVNQNPGIIALGSNLNFLVMKNCRGGGYSFGEAPQTPVGIVISGTFINCVVNGYYGFGHSNAIMSGTWIDCSVASGGGQGFGYNACTLSGTFIRCKSVGYGFGYNGSYLTGVFIDCEGTSQEFANTGSSISGTLYGCRVGGYGFGYNGNITGEFYNCISGDYGFRANFNQQNGIFYHCSTGIESWGYISAYSRLVYCTTKGSFPTVTSGGKTIYCVDGGFYTNNQG